jgi:hypothetical protein
MWNSGADVRDAGRQCVEIERVSWYTASAGLSLCWSSPWQSMMLAQQDQLKKGASGCVHASRRCCVKTGKVQTTC